MKLAFPLRIAALATVFLSSITPFNSAQASTFGEQKVDQSQFIAIARQEVREAEGRGQEAEENFFL